MISMAVLTVTFFILVVLYTAASALLSVLEWVLTHRARNQSEDERERIVARMDSIRQRLFPATAAITFFIIAPLS